MPRPARPLLLLSAALAFTALTSACTKGAPPASLLDSGSESNASTAQAPADAGAPSATLDAGPPEKPLDELQARAKKLFEAIKTDEPDIAMSLFYPREPFVAMKDVKDPGAYWDKLAKDYKAAIHFLHKRLGKKADDAEFDVLELNAKKQVYIAPKKEYNKTGYNKIIGSKLKYKVKGKAAFFDVAVMIDQDSKWYVTHLRK